MNRKEPDKSTREWLLWRIDAIRKTLTRFKRNYYLLPIVFVLALGASFGASPDNAYIEMFQSMEIYIGAVIAVLICIPIIRIQDKEKKQQYEEVIRELEVLCEQIDN